MNKWIVGAVVVALAAPAFAHTGGSVNTDTFVSYDGTTEQWVRNEFETQATFIIEVKYVDGTDVPEELWRSNVADDSVTLAPNGHTSFKVETKEKGKYYVCTKLDNRIGVSSRICSRHWHK